jgi:transposase
LEYLINPGQERTIRYWCEDESRFGLKTVTGRKLTLKGVKPVGQVQWTREAFYLYGIVEPLTGNHFFLEYSHLDTVCFEQFLAQFVQAYPDDIHIIQLDQGRFHSCELLQVPESVILLFQPAHSPQVNPIERLWKEMKKYLRWQSFETLDELRAALAQILDKLTDSVVASVTGWDFILEALFVSGIS